MVMQNASLFKRSLVRYYDDGAGTPNPTWRKERAFRQGFLEQACDVVRRWAHPIEELAQPWNWVRPMTVRQLLDGRRCDSDQEINAAERLRKQIRERYTVCVMRPGGERSRRYAVCVGFRAGHEIPAARARGRHHALVYVTEPWHDLETADVDIFDPKLLCPWLKAVEEWAVSRIRPQAPITPPRVLDVAATLGTVSGEHHFQRERQDAPRAVGEYLQHAIY